MCGDEVADCTVRNDALLTHVEQGPADAQDVKPIRCHGVVGAPLAREQLGLKGALAHRALASKHIMQRLPCSPAVAILHLAQHAQRGILAVQSQDVEHAVAVGFTRVGALGDAVEVMDAQIGVEVEGPILEALILAAVERRQCYAARFVWLRLWRLSGLVVVFGVHRRGNVGSRQWKHWTNNL